MKRTALVLAAGKGTRMKSSTPKVLHKVCGKAMVSHVLAAAEEAGVDNSIIVIGHGAESVSEEVGRSGIEFAVQKEQLGTGHAVKMAEDKLPRQGVVLILCGDTPLITGNSLKKLIDHHEISGNAITVLTAVFDNPFGYGRIIKDDSGKLLKIVEEKEADEATKAIKEINSGMYCFDADFLKNNLNKLNNNNAKGEYYLTDLIQIAVEQNEKTGAFSVEDTDEIMGVNDRIQLSEAEKIMRIRINHAHMANGVTIIDPETAYIDESVVIGQDTIVYPGVILKGNTEIGRKCVIGHNTRIEDSKIGEETEIQSSEIIQSEVGENTKIGPFAYLRPNCRVESNVKIGDFVEVKNAHIGDGTKASHLAYIGDADIGRNVNVGCGVVFVNYDGINKFRTTVEDEAFIGSNSNLVAPVHVEKQGYIAAGTTVSKNVPQGSLFVGRPKERIIPDWGQNKLNEKKEKKNAK